MDFKYRSYQWLGVFFSLLVGFNPSSAKNLYGKIYIDDHFPEEYSRILSQDIGVFSRFPIGKATSPYLKKITHLENLSSSALLDWLQTWVSFIVFSDFNDRKDRLYVAGKASNSLDPVDYRSFISFIETRTNNHYKILEEKDKDSSLHSQNLSTNSLAKIPHINAYWNTLYLKNKDFIRLYLKGFSVLKSNFNNTEGLSGASAVASENNYHDLSSMRAASLGAASGLVSVSELGENSKPVSEGADDVFMVNFGMLKYNHSLILGRYNVGAVFFHDSNSLNIDLVSPSVGMVMIYSDIFDPRRYAPGDAAIGVHQDALSFFRLATLFHEAAHSRGHGKHAGFPHVDCPEGSGVHSGTKRCDASMNGGNGIKASFLAAVVSACKSIRSESDSEKNPYLFENYAMCFDEKSIQFLREAARDSYNRVLNKDLFLDDLFDLI